MVSRERRTLRAKAYSTVVEALKPTGSDLDDEIPEILDEELPRSHRRSPASRDKAELGTVASKDHETVHIVDPTTVSDDAWPNKKRRKS